MNFGTLAVHSGNEIDEETGAVSPPIFLTSTFSQRTLGRSGNYDYSRLANPTRDRLERCVASLEHAKYALAFSSGMAAINSVASILAKDEDVVYCNDVYGGTYRLFSRVLPNYGITMTRADATKEGDIETRIRKNTRMIWLETPTNPLMIVFDISHISKIAKENNLLLVVDNTFASPYLQNPLDLGADIVVHSTTKYIGGHSDLLGGAIATSREDLYEKLRFLQYAVGAVPSPFDCYLCLRGARTLHLRMDRHSENAAAVSKMLEKTKEVKSVNYPFLESSAYHDIARKQMKLGGGMLSFRIAGGMAEAKKFLESLKIFTLAKSLGGVESLVEHPASMTHAALPKEEREKTGITDDLIRLSVGVEDKLDLINDLSQAFKETFS